ncbi:AAA family ATPase [Sulfurimonas lithotrophica]|uniref:AAA family ATPase n=1 Tax=Sulfurimonas lithotrophica TaxID=2590022 RepID=A0A5P8NZ96_9BACT|nr:AAA family ATPase [Sulfurimonas lithotrophica]QFR48762.1 AAA family ATPase [Sulfurimonas lithotrophica]
MLIGLFVRNIKSYEKTFYIPTVKNNKPFTFYIGENGVGKSSILEALDIFFNNREWNINRNSKKHDAFICPVFLIKKESLNLTNNELKIISTINDLFLSWDINDTNYLKSNQHVLNFFYFLQEVKEMNNLNDYYLLLTPLHVSKQVNDYFFSFEKFITNQMEFDIGDVKNLIEKIKNIYSYIYVPVETPVDEILKMETTEMQMLLSEDILEYTEKMLSSKASIDGKKISIVDSINNKLDIFMYEVNDIISNIDNSYAYTADRQFKKYLTPKDIREQIFKAYFSIRSLSKNGKDIVQLSSGEKRKALIDIATAFLKQSSKRAKEVILAVDEPETSMHMKNVFDQFKQLESLVLEHNVQFIGTTHWYGFLPISDYGNLNHIALEDNDIKIKNLDFYNLFEQQDLFPDDIEMKSFFELVTSIITSIKSTTRFNKWIICEGSDDKKYLEYYLKFNQKNSNLRIIPVSGCGNVKKLYHLLYASLSQKDRVKIHGKILCLVDTDLRQFGLDNNILSDKDNTIYIRRIQIHKDIIKLDKIAQNTQRYSQTEVEDCLEPKKYFDTIKHIAIGTDIEQILNSYKQNNNCKISRIPSNNGEAVLLKFDEANGLIEHVNQFSEVISFLEKTSTKQQICNYYVSKYNSEFIPSWILDIVELLELDSCDIPSIDVKQEGTKALGRKQVIDTKKTIEEPIETKEKVEKTISNKNEIKLSKDNKEAKEDISNQEKIKLSSNNKEDLKETLDIEKGRTKLIDKEKSIDFSELDAELLKLFEQEKFSNNDSHIINDYMSKNFNNESFIYLLNKYFIKLSNNLNILHNIINHEIPIKFSIDDLLNNIQTLTSGSQYKLHLILEIMFISMKTFKQDDLEKVTNIINSRNVVNNTADINEFYFTIYVALKLNNLDELRLLFSESALINIINSVETIIYYQHFGKYIQIGYEFKNIIGLSNNLFNGSSYAPYLDIYIHALKQYEAFELLLDEDKKGTFRKKLDNYYKNKPKQNTKYNKLFNKIFSKFSLKEN